MLRVLELFAGIGACSKALEHLDIPHNIVDAVEIDKYAIKSFNAIHGTSFAPQDIREWNKDIEVDLIMHGSPCQDFSIAGKQAGGDKGSGTRSSLMYDTLRIVERLRPKYVIWENVKNLLSQKHRPNFEAYQKRMTELGYQNFYQVLNAKNYGVPQNRERVFTVSIRSDLRRFYEFPAPMPLEKRLKDILEQEADEKYYLSERMLNGLMKHNEKHAQKGTGFIWKPRDVEGVASTLRANASFAPTDNSIRVGCESKIAIKTATKKGYDEAVAGDCVNLAYPDSKTRRGRVGHQVAQTLTTSDNMGVITLAPNTENLRIRRLTPKECWRLMGFDDTDFNEASTINSNTQLYKQAGNSIVVNVLEAILKNLLGVE